MIDAEIGRGAEATVTRTEFLGRDAVLKTRSVKGYRHPDLDSRLRASRTRTEVRVIREARDAGVRTPVIYDVDPSEGTVTMEYVRGTSVKTINYNAFQFCNSLESVEIPSSVTNVGSRAFDGCKSIREVVWHGNDGTIDGGVFSGLPRATALQLAIQTVLGSAKLASVSALHPAILRDQVCSPGGTTIAGVKALEEHGFRDAVMDAVIRATQKSKELGKK